MADAELSLEQIEELKTKAEQADYYKAEADKAFKKRDELKKQLEAEAKAKAEEQGKFKELYESTVPKMSEFEKTIEQLKLDKDEALKVKTDFENAQRTELLKELPDGDAREIGSKLPLMDLRKYTELYKKQESKKHNSTTVGGGAPQKAKTLAEWKKLNS